MGKPSDFAPKAGNTSSSEILDDGKLKILIDDKIKQLGGIHQKENWRSKLSKRKKRKPITDVYYDWATVYGFANQVKVSLINRSRNPNSDKLELERDKQRYATIMAYLEFAKYEEIPGEAWNHVNSADKLLPLIVDDKIFNRCLVRLRGWDSRLAELDPHAGQKLEDIDKRCKEDKPTVTWFKNIPNDLTSIFETLLEDINAMLEDEEQIMILDREELKNKFQRMKQLFLAEIKVDKLDNDLVKELLNEIDISIDEMEKQVLVEERLDIWSKDINDGFEKILNEMIKELNGLFKDKIEIDEWHKELLDDIEQLLDSKLINIRKLFQNKWITREKDREKTSEIKKIVFNLNRKIEKVFIEGGKSDIWKEIYMKEFKEIKNDIYDEIKDLLQAKWKLKILSNMKTKNLEDIFKASKAQVESIWKNQGRPKIPKGPPVREYEDFQIKISDERRNVEYCRQANRAQLWYSINMKNSLTEAIWTTYMKWIILVLIPVIFISEILYTLFYPDEPIWFRPFAIVSLLGFFGGFISSNLIARELVERNASFRLSRTLLLTRMLIGAVGAYVTYALIGSGLASNELAQTINDNWLALISIGIISGFEEQLFISSLDKSAKNLDIIGSSG